MDIAERSSGRFLIPAGEMLDLYPNAVILNEKEREYSMPKPTYITIKEAAAHAKMSPRQFRKRIVDGRASGQYTEADAYEEDTERGKVWYVREDIAGTIGRLRKAKVLKSVSNSES